MMDLMNGFMADMKAGPAWVYNWESLLMGIAYCSCSPFHVHLKTNMRALVLLATFSSNPDHHDGTLREGLATNAF